MKTIGGLFGRSPYGPVHEMMVKVQQCVEKLPDLIANQLSGDADALQGSCDELDRLESQADDIKREIRAHLSTSLFTSVERAEILELTHRLDNVADACQDTGKVMCMRRTEIPEAMVGGFPRLGELLTAAAERMSAVTARLSGTGEEKVTRDTLQGLVEELGEISRVEHDCDTEQHKLQHDLFSMEDRLAPMDIFFLMNIIRELGEVADELENAADSLARALGSR
ncbi:MAG: TIGR00153 family protein [Planctomycetota bacterium]|jgi:predicted phosphate transport protein (TIGR00153 family)